MITSANDTTLVSPDVEKESFSSTENAFVHALCTCSTGRQLTFQIKTPPPGGASHSHHFLGAFGGWGGWRVGGVGWGSRPGSQYVYFLTEMCRRALNPDKSTVKAALS